MCNFDREHEHVSFPHYDKKKEIVTVKPSDLGDGLVVTL
jgi:hypothetical protein